MVNDHVGFIWGKNRHCMCDVLLFHQVEPVVVTMNVETIDRFLELLGRDSNANDIANHY